MAGGAHQLFALLELLERGLLRLGVRLALAALGQPRHVSVRCINCAEGHHGGERRGRERRARLLGCLPLRRARGHGASRRRRLGNLNITATNLNAGAAGALPRALASAGAAPWVLPLRTPSCLLFLFRAQSPDGVPTVPVLSVAWNKTARLCVRCVLVCSERSAGWMWGKSRGSARGRD